MRARLPVLLAALLLAPAAQAGREPVLNQVKVPHSYYWRELYLPQLTTGPSAAAFLPDDALVVYTEGRTEDAKMRLNANPQDYLRGTGKTDYLKQLKPGDLKLLQDVKANATGQMYPDICS